MEVSLLLGIVVGFLIGGFICGGVIYQLKNNVTTLICSECGYRTKDKNIRKCPHCGNPLK